jgi:hypothetical protein
MANNLKDIEKLINEINKSADELRKKKIEVKEKDLPSNMSLMFTGVSNSKALDFLFSSRLDTLLEKLMTLAMSGELMTNIEKFFTNEEDIKKLFDSIGFGEGTFEGPVSKTILQSIQDSMESDKYKKAKNDTQKIKTIYKNLKVKWFSFWNKPKERKKFEEAMYAIEKILKIVAQVYKNRVKLLKGLGNIVTESVQAPIEIEAII